MCRFDNEGGFNSATRQSWDYGARKQAADMAAGTRRAAPLRDRIIIHAPLDILESFPGERHGLDRTQQASRSRPHGAAAPLERGRNGALTKDVGYATRYVQRQSKLDPSKQTMKERALAQAGMAVVTRRYPSDTSEGSAGITPGMNGTGDSKEDMPANSPGQITRQFESARDALGHTMQPSVTWRPVRSIVRHIPPQGHYDGGAIDGASSGCDTAYHGDVNLKFSVNGFGGKSRKGRVNRQEGGEQCSRSLNTQPGKAENMEQYCCKGPECYHHGPESSSASDDDCHCRMDRGVDGLPFDTRGSYQSARYRGDYSEQAERHRKRLVKGSELRHCCRRSTEIGLDSRRCNLQEVAVGHCCAVRPARRRSMRDEQERDIPSSRRKQSPRRAWSPEKRTPSLPTGRRSWTRGDEEGKKKPRPQLLNEALVQSPSDMLLFSKKARPVDYKPRTLKEYRETKPTAYVELGKLQPDLHTEELVAKRANAERVKEFSTNLRQINSDAAARRGKSRTAPTKPAVQDARSRALAFARRIPLPKSTRAKRSADGRDGDELPKTNTKPTPKEAIELEALEVLHDRMRRKVLASRALLP